MNAIKAIFAKQLNDLPRNVSVTLLYLLYPAITLIMSQLLGDADIYAGMFAAMFVGSTPMIAIANTVAEDNEYKSLRFLVMAGVQPWQYLFGLAGFVFLMSLLPLAAFALIGGFGGKVLMNFILIAILGCIASSIFGGAIGIFAKNVQQATAIYTPCMLLLAFMPIFASANDLLARIADFFFSYQVFMVVLEPSADLLHALLVTSANIAVLLAFFIIAYKKKGLRG